MATLGLTGDVMTLRSSTELDIALKQNKIEGAQFGYIQDGSEAPN